MKKVFAILLAVMMIAALAVPAFAVQTKDSGADGSATITIENASKGETYSLYKLFDATVSTANINDEDDEHNGESVSIAYTGDIPTSLADYFEKPDDYVGNIFVKAGAEDADRIAALKAWAAAEEAKAEAGEESAKITSEVSNGDTLQFTNLAYGYYVITSTQDNGADITVDSTRPNAVIYDKNETAPLPGTGDSDSKAKKVDDDDVYVGETVTYTIQFRTVNFIGAGADAKRVVKYAITDTLPDFLEDVTVTGLTVYDSYTVNADGTINATPDATHAITVGDPAAAPQFDNDGTIELAWVDSGANIYNNGALVVLTYTAVVNDNVTISETANVNSVTITPYTEPTTPGGDPEPSNSTVTGSETIKVYAAAIQKVDGSGNPLAGAKFAVKGLTVTGSEGDYTVTAYDATSTENGTEMECDDDGVLYIRGISSDIDFVVTETEAPRGYNKLADTFILSPVLVNETTTTTKVTTYYDADGNVVDTEADSDRSEVSYTMDSKTINTIVNNTGTELPSTGGIGTTIFYVVGGVLVIAAGAILITKRRVGKEN